MADDQRTKPESPATETSDKQPVATESREMATHETAHAHEDAAGDTTSKDSTAHTNSAIDRAATPQASADESTNDEDDTTEEDNPRPVLGFLKAVERH